jgi:hypothetical protein
MDLERLCKIRRLARQSPEPHERNAGECRLTELLAKYGVSEVDLDRHERLAGGRPQPRAARRPPPGFGFPAGVEIEIVAGPGFGSIFGFGFSFGFRPADPTSTQTAP